MTSAEDVIEELPMPVRAALVEAGAVGAEQRKVLAAGLISTTYKKIYEMLRIEEPRRIGNLVEKTGLNSGDVLATLFNLEMKGIIRQLPWKQFGKVLL